MTLKILPENFPPFLKKVSKKLNLENSPIHIFLNYTPKQIWVHDQTKTLYYDILLEIHIQWENFHLFAQKQVNIRDRKKSVNFEYYKIVNTYSTEGILFRANLPDFPWHWETENLLENSFFSFLSYYGKILYYGLRRKTKKENETIPVENIIHSYKSVHPEHTRYFLISKNKKLFLLHQQNETFDSVMMELFFCRKKNKTKIGKTEVFLYKDNEFHTSTNCLENIPEKILLACENNEEIFQRLCQKIQNEKKLSKTPFSFDKNPFSDQERKITYAALVVLRENFKDIKLDKKSPIIENFLKDRPLFSQNKKIMEQSMDFRKDLDRSKLTWESSHERLKFEKIFANLQEKLNLEILKNYSDILN